MKIAYLSLLLLVGCAHGAHSRKRTFGYREMCSKPSECIAKFDAECESWKLENVVGSINGRLVLQAECTQLINKDYSFDFDSRN